MADVIEKPKRKSVAFSEGATIVDGHGQITEVNGTGEKSTAESHSDPAVDEVSVRIDAVAISSSADANSLSQDMFKDLATKKKKKKPKKDTEDDESKPAEGADGELDLSGLKKKKKRKPKAAADVDDFEAKLREAGAELDEDAGDKEEVEEEAPVEEGDMIKGTGIWAHEATQPISYNLLLNRFFTLLHERHPDLAGGSVRSYKIPPPQCLREGNKKTIFANLPEIAKRLKRSEEHITQFLFAELGTSGSVDGSRRLVIKGRFQSKQLEKYVPPSSLDLISYFTNMQAAS
jgi:translation initiation factor 2 subunit 2